MRVRIPHCELKWEIAIKTVTIEPGAFMWDYLMYYPACNYIYPHEAIDKYGDMEDWRQCGQARLLD